MEWVFFVTKPSFLDLFSLADKVMVLLLGGALLSSAVLLGMGLTYLLSRLPVLKRYPRVFTLLGSLLPAFILAALLLLLIDNFTYTLFSFGISTSSGWMRGLYGLLFVVLFIWSDWQVLGMAGGFQAWLGRGKRRRVVLVGVGVWLALGLSLLVVFRGSSGSQLASVEADGEAAVRQPHIIWITGDGLSATHMSLYGYERDTTPTLNALAEESLVGENVFTNAKNTLGSLTSLFTGKPALETRVVYTPDILRAEDAYQHLPGILRAQGYSTIQYGLPYYVDAYAVNLLEGFDTVNGQSAANTSLQARLRRYLPQAMAYFLYETGNRVFDRLRHISYVKSMPNPNETVLTDAPRLEDKARLSAFLDNLQSLSQPTFIHLHLMGTHGPRFLLEEQVFSQGKDPAQQEIWDVDFYDDAMLEFDANVGKIVDALEQQGLLDNTVLIIGSDHATRVDQRQRVPLLIRFPGQEATGRIQANLQGIDIAPTILDYLGLPQPNWMSGQTLLQSEPGKRDIFAPGSIGEQVEENALGIFQTVPERIKPPFYQVGLLNLIDCQNWYELNLVHLSLSGGEVDGHTAPCSADEVITAQQAYDLLVEYLSEKGYDTSSLQELTTESLMEGD
jgi:arylsulfatase A-like enzyme